MKRTTLDAFGKFFDAYTKKQFSKYNEKEAFERLCEAMREERNIKEAINERTAKSIAERRKTDKNYARPKK